MTRVSLRRAWSDTFWAWVLLALAPRAADALTLDAHRIRRDASETLAAHWRRWGWRSRAAALDAKAARHAEATGDDDLPPAVSMGLPRRPRVDVDARGTVVRGPWGGGPPRSLRPSR